MKAQVAHKLSNQDFAQLHQLFRPGSRFNTYVEPPSTISSTLPEVRRAMAPGRVGAMPGKAWHHASVATRAFPFIAVPFSPNKTAWP
jgi:hypothetical protein